MRRLRRRAPSGDLLVVLEVEHDPRFERRGRDLWRVEPISVSNAALETSLERLSGEQRELFERLRTLEPSKC